jgi:hypothetical protein
VSEYQYYEFLAVDRPLDASELAVVRALSTRARVTATRFTNHYSYGSFGGEPRRMVERYYDAHLYLANWGTHQVMLRLPKKQLDLRTVGPYLVQDSVEAWTKGEHLVLDLTSDDESGDWDYDEDSEDSLAAIVGVRAELAAGDLRALYLAWLSALTTWEHQEDDEEAYQQELEPPLPAGLGHLTAPQRALADFLRVDTDLLAAAAQGSPPLTVANVPDTKDLAAWIAKLPAKEKDRLLLRAAQGHEPQLGADLLRRHRASTASATSSRTAETELRSAAQLLDAASVLRTERLSAEKHRRAQREAVAVERRLAAIRGKEDATWQHIEELIATKKPSAYDTAVALLADLRLLGQGTGGVPGFSTRFAELRTTHEAKPSLIQRLDRAGLNGIA